MAFEKEVKILTPLQLIPEERFLHRTEMCSIKELYDNFACR
uniref:Uncharacterized protein n=1 Tax=Nelumbo nucifera TaxID=4432 RepID=A0A822XSN7_NELNU|nr:TPA_asm: hypothetical protein HUJ06_026088 [Nelumbo nucifera]